ncbi:hypothetical protein F7R25_04075 [Burkholderia stagnalis]|uniref:Uncharacterized protein n=1 Tax=Burkholderia stagnalis TaxID=1503054 RepID=A0A6L3N555_9BURK|nr:hypothetical protein [Burkholderia stagnalis]KAB0640682.1 hypothetical protein F7R25_04075 [Burkholderia stagnalis]VWB06485.1 hypothetical protein BST28156_00124 [Burkholderia stagnalis]
MTTKTEIKEALITLAKVWGIKNHSIESADNTFTLIDKASGTVAKKYIGNKDEVYEAINDDIHEIVWTDQFEDYNPALDAVKEY